MNMKSIKIDVGLKKNYLGHHHFPLNTPSVILTIASVDIEDVVLHSEGSGPSKNQKLVFRFQTAHNWVKPWICNRSNQLLIKQKVPQDVSMSSLVGSQLELVIGRDKGFETKVALDEKEGYMTSRKKVKVDSVACVRVKDVKIICINETQQQEILQIVNDINVIQNDFTMNTVLNVYKIPSIEKMCVGHFNEAKVNLSRKLESIKK